MASVTIRSLALLASLGLWSNEALAADKISEIKNAYPPCTTRPTPEAEEQAKSHHKLAVQALEAKRFQDAADLWTKAYALDCSRPRLFGLLGEAFEGAGDVRSAVAMYELFAERAPTEVPDDLPPKIHALRVEAEKLADQEAKAATAAAPAQASRATVLERPLGIAPWVVLASGAAIAVGGGVLVGVGQATVGSAKDGCADPEARTGCTQEAVDDGERGELLSQIGQGLLYGGVGVAALGLILQLAANGEQPVEVTTALGGLAIGVDPASGSGFVGLRLEL
jgi:tetratricopeptide (TPR) repeat protein